MFGMFYACPLTNTITATTEVTTLSIGYDTLQAIFDADERRIQEQRAVQMRRQQSMEEKVAAISKIFGTASVAHKKASRKNNCVEGRWSSEILAAVQKSMRIYLLQMFFES